MDPAQADAWLADAAAGKVRSRNTLYGSDAAAYLNSMRVRIDSYNAFAEFLGLPGRRDSPPPARGFYLTPADTEQVLHDLTVRLPIHANAATAVRTAALAALVADTGRGVPELAHLNVGALHLDGDAHVELADGPCPLGGPAVQVLTRWLSARAAIVAELEGSDPGYLWIPTKPGRPRGGRPPVKPGLTRAAVRTLHAAHRTLVSQLLGTPLRPGALRDYGAAGERAPQLAVPAVRRRRTEKATPDPSGAPFRPSLLTGRVLGRVHLPKSLPVSGGDGASRRAGAVRGWGQAAARSLTGRRRRAGRWRAGGR